MMQRYCFFLNRPNTFVKKCTFWVEKSGFGVKMWYFGLFFRGKMVVSIAYLGKSSTIVRCFLGIIIVGIDIN